MQRSWKNGRNWSIIEKILKLFIKRIKGAVQTIAGESQAFADGRKSKKHRTMVKSI